MESFLNFQILAQPDDTTCGPTCLQSIYAYYQDAISIQQVIQEVPTLQTGGTLAVHLGSHALKRGYQASIYTYNLRIFDPTWFDSSKQVDLKERLTKQKQVKKGVKLIAASEAYIEFLSLGGKIYFKDLNPGLIRDYLKKQTPIVAGLSSTYLYRSMREYGPNDDEDDLRGNPSGHFVVLCGYDAKSQRVSIADPLESNPLSENQQYDVSIERLVGAIFLGVLTYDANFLIIEPKPKKES